MKTFSAEALEALRSGEVIVSGAVALYAAEPIRAWGGFGPLEIDGQTFVGVGDSGLVEASSGTLGGAAQGAELVLSGIDPDIVPQLDLRPLRGVPVVIWRLIFNGTGSTPLHFAVFLRGRVDEAAIVETPGSTSTLRIGVEGAARGLGRRSERMRTDADQRLISGSDSGFSRVAHAGEKTIYLGGRPPQRAGAALGGGGSGSGSRNYAAEAAAGFFSSARL